MAITFEEIIKVEAFEMRRIKKSTENKYYMSYDARVWREVVVNSKDYMSMGQHKVPLKNEIKEDGSYLVYLDDKERLVIRNQGTFRGFKEIEVRLNIGGYLVTTVGGYTIRRGRTWLELFNPVDNMEEMQCDHINRVRTDDSPENLRWVTPQENSNNRNEYEGRNQHSNVKYHLSTADGEFIMTGSARDLSEYIGCGRHVPPVCAQKNRVYKGMYKIVRCND